MKPTRLSDGPGAKGNYDAFMKGRTEQTAERDR